MTDKYLICKEKYIIVSTWITLPFVILQIQFRRGVFDSSGKRRFIRTTDKRRQLERTRGKTISLSTASVITKAVTEITDLLADPAPRNS